MHIKITDGTLHTFKDLGMALHKLGWQTKNSPRKEDVINKLTSFYCQFFGSKLIQKLCWTFARAAKIPFIKPKQNDQTFTDTDYRLKV